MKPLCDSFPCGTPLARSLCRRGKNSHIAHFFGGLMVGMLVVALAGCGGNTPAETTSASPTAEQAVQSGSGDPDPAENGEEEVSAREMSDATTTPVPATATTAATSTPEPTPTATLTSTVTPTPAPQLRQLTTGGCCTQPFWGPESQQVLYIDAPPPDGPVGIWGVDTTQAQAEPQLVTERIGFYTDDFEYIVEITEETTTIERLSDGERWTVPAGGNLVSFSPNRERIAWNESDEDVPWEDRIVQVWVANFDGSDARQVATQRRGGFDGWLTDDTFLLTGRESFQSEEEVTVAYSLTDGSSMELLREERVRGSSLSPNREWLAYYIAQNEDASKNGIWMVRTDGSDRRKLPDEYFGAYKWRPTDGTGSRLLFVPFDPDAEYHELWQYDVETEQARQLTDSETTPFKIANGDWTVSPDGQYVAFVEAADDNIWVLELP